MSADAEARTDIVLSQRTCVFHRELGPPWSNGLPCGCWRVAQDEIDRLAQEVERLERETELRAEESAAANRLLIDLRTHLMAAEAEVERLWTLLAATLRYNGHLADCPKDGPCEALCADIRAALDPPQDA